MKIRMHRDNLGIESGCSWATPAPMKPADANEPDLTPAQAAGRYFDYTHPSVVVPATPVRTKVLSPLPTVEAALPSYDIRNLRYQNKSKEED